jgi:mannitol-specific phosphotransferase system IIBC component
MTIAHELAQESPKVIARNLTGAGVVLAVTTATLIFGGVYGPAVVQSIIAALGVAEAGVAVAIVNAVIAGSAVATVVAALIGGGVGAAAIAGIRWAISFYGKKKAIQ